MLMKENYETEAETCRNLQIPAAHDVLRLRRPSAPASRKVLINDRLPSRIDKETAYYDLVAHLLLAAERAGDVWCDF